MEENDKQLYQEFLKGNQVSFEKIMDKYSAQLIYFIYSYVKNIEAAKDLSQDVWVYLLINKEKYDFRYSLKTYLYIIAKCRAINYLKKNRNNITYDEEKIEQNSLYYEIEETVFSNIRNLEVRNSIGKLKKDQR